MGKKISTEYGKIQSKLTSKVNPLFHSENTKDIFEQISSGKNKYLKYKRIENTAYDPTWIKEIEDCLYDLGCIIKNPRLATISVGDVVPVEKARKTNSESIIHLATHSQYVKDYDEKDTVTPNKILNIGADDLYQTYENRFIATLIRKLVLFVEKRCDFIQQNTLVKESEILYLKSVSNINGKDVEIETKVKVSSNVDTENENINNNKAYAARVENLRKYLLYYYNSDFMKKMKTERNVRNPILMTNIIRKNVLYNHAYRLYKFIETYELLGVDFKVDEKFADLNSKDIDELNNTLMSNFLSLRSQETFSVKKEKIKKYRPKVETSIDDESFIYGPWLNTPFEFVRIDNAYLEHIDALRKPVPGKPSKIEKLIINDDLLYNKELSAEKKELSKLSKFKKFEATRKEREFAKVVEEREKEEARLLKEKKDKERQEMLNDIEMARRALMGNVDKTEPIIEQPTVEPVNTREESVEDIPIKKEQVKKPVTKKKPKKKAAAAKKPAPIKEEPKKEEPVIVETPKPEPILEPAEIKQPVEEIVKEEKFEEKPASVKITKPVKPAVKRKAPAKKVVKETPTSKVVEKPAPKVIEKPVEKQRDKIPGRFIVKLNEGYYVDKNVYSDNKVDAKIFDDFNLANDIKKEKGGKVVKL